jgi:hypothetical protein
VDNAPSDELSGEPLDTPADTTNVADDIDQLAVIEAELAAAEAELDELESNAGADSPVAE